MQVLVQSYENRGKSPSTRWGTVTFDAKGFATMEIPEKDLPLLESLKWLVQTSATPAKPVTPPPIQALPVDRPPPDTRVPLPGVATFAQDDAKADPPATPTHGKKRR